MINRPAGAANQEIAIAKPAIAIETESARRIADPKLRISIATDFSARRCPFDTSVPNRARPPRNPYTGRCLSSANYFFRLEREFFPVQDRLLQSPLCQVVRNIFGRLCA